MDRTPVVKPLLVAALSGLALLACGRSGPAWLPFGSGEARDTGPGARVEHIDGFEHVMTAGEKRVARVTGDSALVTGTSVLVWNPRVQVGPGRMVVQGRTARKTLGGTVLQVRGDVVVQTAAGQLLARRDQVEFDGERETVVDGEGRVIGGG